MIISRVQFHSPHLLSSKDGNHRLREIGILIVDQQLGNNGYDGSHLTRCISIATISALLTGPEPVSIGTERHASVYKGLTSLELCIVVVPYYSRFPVPCFGFQVAYVCNVT